MSRSDPTTGRLSTYTFPPELRIDELLLRPASEADVPVVAPAFQDPAVGPEAGIPPFDEETLRTLMREQLPGMIASGLLCPYVIVDTGSGELLGGLTLQHFDPMRDSVEVGYLALRPRTRTRRRDAGSSSRRRARVRERHRPRRGARARGQRRVGARARACWLRARGREAAVPAPRPRREVRRDALRAARRGLTSRRECKTRHDCVALPHEWLPPELSVVDGVDRTKKRSNHGRSACLVTKSQHS